MEEKIKEQILEICEELCCKKITSDEELIASRMLDSFKTIELINSLEEEFYIIFEPEEISGLENFSCVNNICHIVQCKLKRGQICQKI